jgi:hypothetical protein
MAIPDKYNTSDSTTRILVPVSDPAKKPPLLPFGPLWQYNRDHHGKRKDKQPDCRYASRQVAAVHSGPGAASSSQQCKKNMSNMAKYTIDNMLDQPCKFHNAPRKLATHMTC